MREKARRQRGSGQKLHSLNARKCNFWVPQPERSLTSVPLVQPYCNPEKDIGAKNPETAVFSGFFRAFFQGGIQKISFPKNDFWGGLELNTLVF